MNEADAKRGDAIERVAIVAGCLIKRDGKYLLVQEKQQRAYGLWNLPAGHVDKGESIEQAAVREAKEESGFQVELGLQVGLFHENTNAAVKHVFTGKIVGGELKFPPDEILDANWFTFEEVRQLHADNKLRARWIWDVISTGEEST